MSSTLYGLGIEQRRYTDIVLELCRGGDTCADAEVVRRIPTHRIILATCEFFDRAFEFSSRLNAHAGVDDDDDAKKSAPTTSAYRLDIDQTRICNSYVNEESVCNFIHLLYTCNSTFSELYSFQSTEEGREDFYKRACETIGCRALDFIAVRECADYFQNTVVAKLVDNLVTRTDWDAANCRELSQHYVGRNMLLAIYYRYRCFCSMQIQKKYDFWLFETAREFFQANYECVTKLSDDELARTLRARCVTHLLVDPDESPSQPSYSVVTTRPIELKVLANEAHGEIVHLEMATWNVVVVDAAAAASDDDVDHDDDEMNVEPPSTEPTRKRARVETGDAEPRVDDPTLQVHCYQHENMKVFAYTLEGPPLNDNTESDSAAGAATTFDFLPPLKRRVAVPVTTASAAPEHLRATTTLCFVAETIFTHDAFSRRFVLNDAVDVIVGGTLASSRGVPTHYNFRICLEYVINRRNRARTKPAWRSVSPEDRRELASTQESTTSPGETANAYMNANVLVKPLVQHESAVRAAAEHDDDDEQTDYRFEAVLCSRDEPTIFSYFCRERVNARTSTVSSSSAFNVFVCNGTNVKYGRVHLFDMCIGKIARHRRADDQTRLVVSLTLPRLFSR